MTPSELKQMLADIRAIPLTPALSDDALSALTRIYVSVYNMIAGDGTDDVYGDRKVYEGELDRLYDLCRERGNRMADAMHRLLRHPMRQTDPAKIAEWRALAAERPETSDAPATPDTAHVMQLLDPSFFGPTGGVNLSATDCRTLADLYEQNQWGPGRPDPAVLDRIVDFVRRGFAQMHAPASAAVRSLAASASPASVADTPCRPEEGDARLWLLSVLIDRACRQASSALQEEYFAHSA